jgi:hypothetical protein
MGKLAKGFSDREVAVDLGPDYNMTKENSLWGWYAGRRLSFSMNMSVGEI